MATGKTRFLHGLLGLHAELERMIHDMAEGRPGAPRWKPAADVYVSGGKVVVRFELAGVNREEIDLTFKDSALLVRGMRLESESQPKERFWQMEIAHGPFERIVEIPVPVDPDGIEAVCRDGILEVALPVVPAGRGAGKTEKS
jgi:HSP20 family protein